jgi:ADP-heptose:LPS heptosyltransferase
MTGSPRILVVRFSSLGDVILTTPLLRALRARYPQATITFVTKRQYAPVLEHNPHISRLVALEPGADVAILCGQLRHDVFDARLDLHGSMRSWRLRRALGGSWGRFPKHRLRRWRLLWFGAAAAPPLAPVAER